jgi:hypothetical protein
MKKLTIILLIVAALLSAACDGGGKKDWTDYRFSDSLTVRHTAIRNQGRWPVGWIYATLGMVESDRIKVGDSLDLSATYLMRRNAEGILMRSGGLDLSDTLRQFRGTPYSCINLMNKVGILTYSCYRRRLAMGKDEFFRTLNRRNAPVVLDTAFAYVPPYVGLYGALYTPTDLARSLYVEGSYQGFISTTAKPRGELRTAMPGDFWMESYYNVSPDEMIHMIDATLHKGYSLVWMGDTTETTCSPARGCGYWPEWKGLSRDERERQLHNGQTTADHCMQIIGVASGKPKGIRSVLCKPERFFICRDSHGPRGPYKGLVYLSENYVRMKTVAVYRHKPVRQISF